MRSFKISRKRTCPAPCAVPQTSARRMRLDDGPPPPNDLGDEKVKVGEWRHNDKLDNITTPPPPPADLHSLQVQPAWQMATPPTPHPSPESHEDSDNECYLDQYGRPVHIRISRPGRGTDYDRNEFPFPIQPVPKRLRERQLEAAILEEPDETDVHVPGSECPRRDKCMLPTPPHSHPSLSTSRVPPTPASSVSSSDQPPRSPSHPYSPLSPAATPLRSVLKSLKLVLMADELGVSVQELEELSAFACGAVSGPSKRAGRVLVRNPASQRKEKDRPQSDQGPRHEIQEREFGNCAQHSVPDAKWRDIKWSSFSDSSDEEMGDLEADTGLGFDGSDEESVSGGTNHQECDEDEISLLDLDLANKAVLETARVGRVTRPAKLCMETSIERVESANHSLGGNFW